MNRIIQINNNFTACVQSVRHQHVISDGRATVQSQTKFASSVFAGHHVTNLCFVYALLHNTPNFIIYKSILINFYNIHLMQFSFHCNITFFSVCLLSQVAVATLLV